MVVQSSIVMAAAMNGKSSETVARSKAASQRVLAGEVVDATISPCLEPPATTTKANRASMAVA
jgi:hypothetical protein